MKKHLALSLHLLISTFLFAQAPQGIPYQAVIRDNFGAPLVNASVTVRFTLHQNTIDGPVEYQETQSLSTNAFGVINTQFGMGMATQGSFENIIWSNTTKFIQVEANDGSGYLDMGTQQMMSVPYAMYAGSAGNSTLPQGNEPGSMLVWNGSNWETIAPPTSSHASLNWCDGEIKWGDCPAVFSDWSCCFSSQLQANFLYCPSSWLGFGMIQSDNINLDNAINLNFVGLNSGGGISGAGYITYPISYNNESQYYKAYFINNNADTSWSSVYHYIPSSIQCDNPLACNYDILSLTNTNCIFDNNNDGICNDSFVIQCADSNACNFSVLSTSNTFNDCVYDLDNNGSCSDSANFHCNDPAACNYFLFAYDNSECTYPGGLCDDGNMNSYDDIINSSCNCTGTIPTESGTGAQLLPGNTICETENISVTGCNGQTSITYFDRSYNLVEIFGQCWFAENLATDKYQNGDAILTGVPDGNEWETLQIGAYSNYNNNYENDILYGKLYNAYAAIDDRNVCPTGWHVPTDCDWMYLENSLGMSVSNQQSTENRGANEGGSLKSLSLWNAPNEGASNAAGFNALPGGFRNWNDGYFVQGDMGVWWSNTQTTDNNVYWRSLFSWNAMIGRNNPTPNFGASIRCIKN